MHRAEQIEARRRCGGRQWGRKNWRSEKERAREREREREREGESWGENALADGQHLFCAGGERNLARALGKEIPLANEGGASE